MRSFIPLLGGALAVLGLATAASAATQVVNSFGDNNWYSWDTRNPGGTQLFGSNDTNPAWATWSPGAPPSSSTADDAAIQSQIVFMNQGQVANDAAGNTPPAGPTGSLNGLGYVRLDGTSSNNGKSDISYVDLAGITAASTLTDPGFSVAYSFYSESSVSPYISREPGLNIAIIGTDDVLYTLAYTPGYTPNAWNTESADSSTGAFTIHSSNALANGVTDTIANLAANPDFGSDIFGPGAEVIRVGFNIGSGQHAGLVYLDDLQTSLLNGGDVIDFQGPSEVPEPASLGLLGIGALALLARRRRA